VLKFVRKMLLRNVVLLCFIYGYTFGYNWASTWEHHDICHVVLFTEIKQTEFSSCHLSDEQITNPYTHKMKSLDLILCQINPCHIPTSYFLKIRFIPPSVPRYQNLSLIFEFCTFVSYACYILLWMTLKQFHIYMCAYIYVYITVLNATFTSILCFVYNSSYHCPFRLHVAVIVHHHCPTVYLLHSQSQIHVTVNHKSYH
jgi:hypothetical protein